MLESGKKGCGSLKRVKVEQNPSPRASSTSLFPLKAGPCQISLFGSGGAQDAPHLRSPPLVQRTPPLLSLACLLTKGKGGGQQPWVCKQVSLVGVASLQPKEEHERDRHRGGLPLQPESNKDEKAPMCIVDLAELPPRNRVQVTRFEKKL